MKNNYIPEKRRQMLFNNVDNKRKFFSLCLILCMIFGQVSMTYAFDSDKNTDAQNKSDNAQIKVEKNEQNDQIAGSDDKKENDIPNGSIKNIEEEKILNNGIELTGGNQPELREAPATLPDEIKKIEFTDSELLDTLGIRVGSDYIIKAINLAKADGKEWKNLSNEEKEAYYNKAKAIILKEAIENNIYLSKFNKIKNDVKPYLDKLGVTAKSEDLIRNNKHHFVMGLAYLEKLYNVPVDNTGKTLKDKLYDGLAEQDKVQAIINIGKQSSTSLDYRQISTLYNNVISVNFKKIRISRIF